MGVARYDLRIPESRSLKDKRSVVRHVTSMLQRNFACAVAEVEHQDLRQRAAVGVSIVSGSSFHARKVLSEITRSIEAQPGIEMLHADVDVIVPEDLS